MDWWTALFNAGKGSRSGQISAPMIGPGGIDDEFWTVQTGNASSGSNALALVALGLGVVALWKLAKK